MLGVEESLLRLGKSCQCGPQAQKGLGPITHTGESFLPLTSRVLGLSAFWDEHFSGKQPDLCWPILSTSDFFEQGDKFEFGLRLRLAKQHSKTELGDAGSGLDNKPVAPAKLCFLYVTKLIMMQVLDLGVPYFSFGSWICRCVWGAHRGAKMCAVPVGDLWQAGNLGRCIMGPFEVSSQPSWS